MLEPGSSNGTATAIRGARGRRSAASAGIAAIGALVAIGAAASALAAPNTFVTLAGGTEIAMNVRMPTNYVPGVRYPTVFEMSGYDGGSAENGTLITDFGLEGLPLPL